MSEIAAPMVLDGVLLGVLNIESTAPEPLDRIDRDLVATMAGKIAAALALARDRQALADLAVRDGLTGLHNRRFFDDRGPAADGRNAMPESERRPVAAILFDLDHFGSFNKLHGVQVGDQAAPPTSCASGRDRPTSWRGSAARSSSSCSMAPTETRPSAWPKRFASDSARAPSRPRTARRWLTVSAGCAALDDAEPTAEALLRTADVALSMAKRGGRDRVVAA